MKNVSPINKFMRLLKFLNESEKTDFEQAISEEKAQELLETRCSKNKNFDLLYRGNKFFTEKYYLFNSATASVRKSSNTSNYYTLLFSDILPS